jgi:hypothetical protein
MTTSKETAMTRRITVRFYVESPLYDGHLRECLREALQEAYVPLTTVRQVEVDAPRPCTDEELEDL